MTLLTTLLFAGNALAGPIKPYPKDICIVSDNKLGSMGTPVTMVYDNQELKFCCKPCVRKFDKDPQKYLPKLAEK